MFKGDLANTTQPHIWVHSDVVVKLVGRKFFIGPKKYELVNQSWLWSLTYFATPIIIYINQPKFIGMTYESLIFNSFQEAKEAMRIDNRVLEMIVVDRSLVSSNVNLYSKNAGIHGY
jgi:hypothetical protein